MTDQAGRRVTERFTPQNVHFVCEQDGAPERELKDRLATTLRSMGVKKAYLAVVSYDDRKGPHTTAGNHSTAETSVALCITLQDAPAGKHDIVERAGHDFAALFGSTQRMDIVFLTDQQELALSKVCRPFYMAMESA